MTHTDPTAVLAQLERTPHQIESVTRTLSAEDLTWKPSADSWSINEVLAHLRACADVWGGSIARILDEDNPTIRYISPRTWIRRTDYAKSDFQAAFLAFRGQREDLLKVLRPLGDTAWQRRATVKAASLREETVLSFARRIADHEAAHCGQIDRILHARRQE